MQIQFKLPEIDREETKSAVEEALENYRYYALQISLDKLPSVTANYSLTPNSNSLPSSSTEIAAVANVTYDQQRSKYINWIVSAVNRLTKLEREIIYKAYMQEDEEFDYQIYRDLNISERSYYRMKSRTFYKLAFALKIEVYKEMSENEGCTAN